MASQPLAVIHNTIRPSTKKPAYSFGSRFKISEKVCSPGPVYFVKDEITRVGKEGSAKYTQLGRRKESRAFKTPGPGRYENHRCHPQGEIHFPKYSMGSRTKYRKCDAYPAANSYSLPQLIGPKIPSKPASNAYSMTSRRSIGSFDQDLARTPGAARYNVIDQNIYNKQSPQYSMLARRFVPGDKTKKTWSRSSLSRKCFNYKGESSKLFNGYPPFGIYHAFHMKILHLFCTFR